MDRDSFNALRDEWYAKLKETGFRDIESWGLQENGDLEPMFLVDHVGRGRSVAEQGARTQGDELFVILGRHFHTCQFQSIRHRVWALLYVNGWRGAEIARLFEDVSAVTITCFLKRFREDALATGLHNEEYEDVNEDE